MYDDGLDPDAPFDEDRWELYHVAEDFSECHDLAERDPARLADLVERWWAEARASQRAPARQPAARRVAQPAPDPAERPHARRAPRDGRPGSRGRSHPTCTTARTSCAPSWTCRVARSPPACWSPRARCSAAGRSTSSTAARVTSTTSSERNGTASCPPRRFLAGLHAVGFEFERTADFAGIGRLYLDDELSRRGRDPALHPGPVLHHRRRAHVRLRRRARRLRRLPRAVHVQRGPPPRDHRRERRRLPRRRSRVRRDHGGAVSDRPLPRSAVFLRWRRFPPKGGGGVRAWRRGRRPG